MVLKFKPQFWKDINKLKEDKEVMSLLYRIFRNVDNAKGISQIHHIKPLVKFESRYRIKLFLDKKRDYRVGVFVHKNTVWFARFLHRMKIYEEHW